MTVAQKSLIKIILGKPKYTSSEIFKSLRVFDTDTLFKKQSIHFIYKYNLIKFKIQHYNTRHINIEIPFLHSKKASTTFIQIGFRSLNFIPIDILNCTNYSNF